MNEHYNPKMKKANDDMKEVCELRTSLGLPCRRCMYCDECAVYINKLDVKYVKGERNGGKQTS